MKYHLQIAVYLLMLRKIATAQGWKIGDIKGSVLLRSDTGKIPALDSNTLDFDLNMHETIVEHLVGFPDSILNQISQLPFEDIFYQPSLFLIELGNVNNAILQLNQNLGSYFHEATALQNKARENDRRQFN